MRPDSRRRAGGPAGSRDRWNLGRARIIGTLSALLACVTAGVGAAPAVATVPDDAPLSCEAFNPELRLDRNDPYSRYWHGLADLSCNYRGSSADEYDVQVRVVFTLYDSSQAYSANQPSAVDYSQSRSFTLPADGFRATSLLGRQPQHFACRPGDVTILGVEAEVWFRRHRSPSWVPNLTRWSGPWLAGSGMPQSRTSGVMYCGPGLDTIWSPEQFTLSP
ncbi:MAG: hypothetical protein HY830_18460 [Actinobacteria bacterium]|nr:hypothetical protein [Actinomycetota bacterium]